MNLFNKYKYWINSGKYSTIQKLSVLFIGILSFMLLARMLGPEGYGIWGLFIVITSITETTRTALIRNAFIRFIHQSEESEHGFVQGAAFILSASISGVLALLFFLLAGPAASLLNAPSLEYMLKLYAISLLISTFFAHFEMLLNAKMVFRGICFMYCVRQGFLFIFVLVYFFFPILHLTPYLLSVYYLIALAAGSFTGYLMARPYLQLEFSGYKKWMPRLWSFGKYVFGNNLSSQLFRSTDNFVVSNFFGPAISALYNASLRISNLVDMPSAVLADIMFPKMAKYNSSDKSSVRHLYERGVAATLVFSIPALLVILLFPELILHILAGEKFVQAAPILRITAFFGFTLPFLKQFGTVMDGTGSPQLNFRLMFAGFVINVLTNITFVHFFGIIGAAIGTATTYLILFVVSQFMLNRKFGIRILSIMKNVGSIYLEIFNGLKPFLIKRKVGEI